MPGLRRSAASGPLTWMLSNATSTVWSNPRQRKGRQGEKWRGPNREGNKGETK